ncbi:hypothetical protein HW130_00530 [Streptomyces sp. PKU-EA00015]|uniref:hypothetical protein n=1 Tax=unclassified Streptomyces TaxID=2593676 RepID=UPI0015A3216D|nr:MULTISPECIES: hypothetical protein [unclassified Streptomyces]MDQ1006838.1 hypothetical protein [Streptomyces sp. V4I23]NWF24766.1 hypothetical protein [Streptomyces sp. PKU-EA00015]
MSDIEALLDELNGLPSAPPSGPADLEALLAAARSAAGRWADVLEGIREASRGLAGPRTEAALEVAFRRAEESYVELEIALSACAGPRPH